MSPPTADRIHDLLTTPDACSVRWDDPELPAWGTAPGARFVVALEEPGPWGARALTESRLDPQVGGALEERCLDARGRALLVRPVDVRRGLGERRRFFLAGGFGHTPWLLAGTVSHPAELLDLPLASRADADRVPSTGDGWPAQDLGGLLLVCANGRRDLCCARRGRAVAARCAARRPGRVWESSHLGGHRFAPTALLLPTGQSLARVTPDLAASALDAAASGRLALGLGPWHDRGRLHLDPGAQVADAAVRHATGESDPGALRVAPAGPEAFDVGHVDGRSWRVGVRSEQVAPPRPDSCGKAPVPTLVWRADVQPS